MDISELINPESVILNLEVSSKRELLEKAIERGFSLQPKEKALLIEKISEAVFEREKTGVITENGFTMPHARIEGLANLIVVVALPKTPVDYDAPDGKPVDLVTMVLIPEDQPTIALKIMSEIIRTVSTKKDKILFAGGSRKISAIFSDIRVDIDEPIIASDIMKAPKCRIYIDTPLKEISRLMDIHKLSAVPVIDKNDRVVGSITDDAIFHIGIPDFFKSLKSVSFVSDFDPFEEYFQKESGVTAKDIMSLDTPVLEKSNTILEIVFLLTVKNCSALYVIEDDKLIGVIDKSTVLNKIINL